MFEKQKHYIIFILIFSPNLAAESSIADDNVVARNIMEQVDQRDDGDNRVADIEMILIDKNNNQRPRVIKSYTKDFGKDTYSALFFVSPADVKNTAFLTYDYANRQQSDDQWLYLPALRKSKRIASAEKSSSFMGSDFNYSDMTSINIDNYDFTLKKEIKVRNHDAWVIEAIPRSSEIIKETGYKKSLLIIRKDINFIVRAVHWPEQGDVLKYLDIPGLELVDNIWTATEMTMTSKHNNDIVHKTVMKFTNIKYQQTLDKDMFTVRQIEKGL